MKNIISKLVLVAFLFSFMGTAVARECTTCKKSTAKQSALQSKAAVCKRAQSTAELNVNNVRALINAYGNMWFDGSVTQYHLPKNSNSTPLYCAALWIGGTDVNGQLRIAALCFGSYGDDYWPGPLELQTAYIDREVCNKYDKHFIITKTEVMAFRNMFNYTYDPITNEITGAVPNPDTYDEAAISQTIKDWPAHGEGKQSKFLAPFCDVDGDMVYDWHKGDYPYYDFDNDLCPRTYKSKHPYASSFTAPTMETQNGIVAGGNMSDQVLKGDQTIWWVFNDMGNTHTETNGQPIGMEIRAQAFAFSTNDEINNMTFYSYEIINRSTYTLKNTYFSQWVDPDLGDATDDFVGCDVKRGLGYCYNGNSSDGPGTGRYSGIPPAVGIDFFQGPYMDPDGKDNAKLDFEKLKANARYAAMLDSYKKMDSNGNYVGNDANGNIVYDTFALTLDADLFYDPQNGGAWYFKPGDTLGNCAINGVNFGNGIVDDERFGMRRFVYYDNGSGKPNTDPRTATDYYYFLQGRWKSGRRMWFGGNGLTDKVIENLECDFMFPGDSDPWNWGTNGVAPSGDWANKTWTESNSENTPGDRRFMQSAGPFTLQPGACNYITVGIPFAQAPSGGPQESVALLRQVDDVCQALFENCFKVLDGPAAPTMIVQEMNNEVILYLNYDNPKCMGENYEEEDISISSTYKKGPDDTDYNKYKFEGYQIYQLVDANASVSDIGDVTKARLVAQCDLENYYDAEKTLPIATLVNFETNSATGILSGEVKVQGANKGIQHVFRVTNDQFASGTNTRLVNNREYYFICIAYAHNRYKEYSQTDAAYLDGQKEPYLAGRQDEWGSTITPVVAIPHDPTSENGGTIINAEFGMSPSVTRLEGFGNGGNTLMLKQSSIDELMGAEGVAGMQPGEFTFDAQGNMTSISHPCVVPNPVYEENAGPLNVRVVDPLSVKAGKFVINFTGVDSSSVWYVTNADPTQPVYDDVDTVYSTCAIGRLNEQLFLDLGIAVSIQNPHALGTKLEVDLKREKNYYIYAGGLVNSESYIGSEMSHADVNQQWLSGIPDNDNMNIFNWVRSGMQFNSNTGSNFTGASGAVSMFEPYLDEDYFKQFYDLNDPNARTETFAIDKDNVFEDVVSGMWAPYGLVSTLDFHPGFGYQYYMPDDATVQELANATPAQKCDLNKIQRGLMDRANAKTLNFFDMASLPSVRIVFTADTSKWTRCPVLEMCEDYTQSEGNVRKFQKRAHLSVDKMGKTVEDLGVAANVNDPNNPAYVDAYGMGWFPGYAINTSTGERLNMMFGEDSRYVQFNGRDMMWNPVSSYIDGTQNYVMGGRHFIYVMNATNQYFYDFSSSTSTKFNYRYYATPSYDAGRWANTMLGSLDRLLTYKDDKTVHQFYNGLLYSEAAAPVSPLRDSVSLLFTTVAWVNMPLVNDHFAFKYPGHNAELNEGYASDGIPCDAVVEINVNVPYGRFMGSNGTSVQDCGMDLNNNNHPRYMFELSGDMVTLTNQAISGNVTDSIKDAILNAINVVPNPYYSYSSYETLSQLETKVRFVNLPANSVISIYTVDGTLVRRLGPTPSNTSTLDWDLHNHTGIPIAGGMYLVHVNVPNIGERVIKWFGTMRPVDLNSFKF
ncbi:MAG: hypothetical protein MJZ42_02930 [Bacteroidales bacterium]|nr:hypothetical protein [Bacteroidales bacterium]